MARTHSADRLLTTAEAATRLGMTAAYVATLARQGEFGLKDEGGRWVIRASEVRAYKRRRQRADPFALPWRRAVPAPREPRAPRLSRADRAAMTLLDDLVARERAIERAYDLPFRAPQRVGLTVHPCQICHRDMVLLIFADHARDAEGLLAYGRLVAEPIRRHGLPAYALAPLELTRPIDASRSLLMRVWPERDEAREITPPEFDRLLTELSMAHCYWSGATSEDDMERIDSAPP